MANPEHLDILKQGVNAWNQWRVEYHDITPDLSVTILIGEELSDANLSDANLVATDLSLANLRNANLSSAELIGTNLRNANLSDADLRNANLRNANLSKAILIDADLSYSKTEDTTFGSVDLSNVKGFETVRHTGPSIIDTDTILNSKGRIPEVFLRGCGMSDFEIEFAKLYQPGLPADETSEILYRVHELRHDNPIQINPLFISYSHANTTFVDAMEEQLNERGIRYWRDIHDMTAGRIEKQVDRAIRHNPTVLLTLSEHSVNSDWVQHEARLARKLEIDTGRDVLCPIALDNSWKTCRWPARLREQIMEYNILDFSDWQNDTAFKQKFERLIDGLGLFYQEDE